MVETGTDVDNELLGCRVDSRTTHVQYAIVHDSECLVIFNSMSLHEAVFFEFGRLALHTIRRGRVGLGHAVGVFGLGVLGQLLGRCCDAAGSRPIFAFQTVRERRALLPSRPHIFSQDPRRDSWVETVERETDGRLWDIVLDATGDPDAIGVETRAFRERGWVVVASSPTSPTRFDFHEICRDEYEVVGAHVYHHPSESGTVDEWTAGRNTDLFFRLVGDGVVNVEGLVTHTRSTPVRRRERTITSRPRKTRRWVSPSSGEFDSVGD